MKDALTTEERLSPTMRKLVELMRATGGNIYRRPGGFWHASEFPGTFDGSWFGTSTVHALVTRGVAQYTEWKEHRHGQGRFPIKATLVQK